MGEAIRTGTRLAGHVRAQAEQSTHPWGLGDLQEGEEKGVHAQAVGMGNGEMIRVIRERIG